jgi:VWFA-related protein
LAVFLAFAPVATSQDDRFAETTDVVLVEIAVNVTQNGQPVRGLTAENFEVLEGRKKQAIVAVDEFDLELLPSSEDSTAATGVPPAGRRSFLLLFDLSNSQPAGVVRAREAALDLATTGLQPSDLVAVATYSKTGGAQILMNFSTDRAQLVAAVDNLGLVQPFHPVSDPLRMKIAEIEEGGNDGLARGAASAVLLETLKDISTFTTRNTRDQQKQQILDLSSNLDELARLMDSISGRKQIVLFSQGFDSEVIFGTSDSQRIAEITTNVETGQLWRVDAEERFGASDAQADLLQMLERFNRSDCAIHTVDTSGLAAGGNVAISSAATARASDSRPDRGHDGLFLIANQTGGEFYRNYNNLSSAMDDLLERTIVTYVVSIQPKNVPMDGAYHPLKVRLKNGPKGASLSHRPGYYARRPYSELDPMERQLVTAEQLIAGSPGGAISTNLLAAAFPGSGASANILTAIEIDGNSLTSSAPDNVVPAAIYTYAFDEQGRIVDFFSQAVVIDLYKVGYRLNTGFKLLSHLELPPGNYQIRSLVRNVRTGASGLAVSVLTVPDFVEGEMALLPPFFIEPDDLWLIGEAEQEETDEAPYPLMGGGKRMVPASRPRLVSGQSIPVLLVGYHLPAHIEAAGHLVGDNGTIYQDIVIAVDNRVEDRGDGERLVAKLIASGIKPGYYELVVTLRGEGREISSSLPVLFQAYN